MVPRKRRLGVVGTLVWDVIYGCPPASERVEGWGGIAYALSALAAALPESWEIVPILKVGEDVAARAEEFLSTLRNVAPDMTLVVVPEPNNRSELRYITEDRRTEQLSGHTPAWSWAELEPSLSERNVDAQNFAIGIPDEKILTLSARRKAFRLMPCVLVEPTSGIPAGRR